MIGAFKRAFGLGEKRTKLDLLDDEQFPYDFNTLPLEDDTSKVADFVSVLLGGRFTENVAVSNQKMTLEMPDPFDLDWTKMDVLLNHPEIFDVTMTMGSDAKMIVTIWFQDTEHTTVLSTQFKSKKITSNEYSRSECEMLELAMHTLVTALPVYEKDSSSNRVTGTPIKFSSLAPGKFECVVRILPEKTVSAHDIKYVMGMCSKIKTVRACADRTGIVFYVGVEKDRKRKR